VPGDPLAGYLLTSLGVLDGQVGFAILASLSLYAAGLLMNDLFDLEEDRRERPNRPLPSGAATPRQVWLAIVGLSATGVGALAFGAGPRGVWLGGALLGSIGLYNKWTKRISVIGSFNMGLCRGLSVLVGAVVACPRLLVWKGPAFPAACIIAFYIATLTNLAGFETRQHAPAAARLLPLGAALIGLFMVIRGTGAILESPASALFGVGVFLVAVETVPLFRKPPPPLPPVIGTLIRALLVFQAAFCLALWTSLESIICAIALLLAYPISRMVSRRFYAS
jgi:4-hydroxybenzoate polyprenyltransferase